MNACTGRLSLLAHEGEQGERSSPVDSHVEGVQVLEEVVGHKSNEHAERSYNYRLAVEIARSTHAAKGAYANHQGGDQHQ